MLTGTVWEDTVWKDVWKAVWAAPAVAVVRKDGLYFMEQLGGGIVYLKQLTDMTLGAMAADGGDYLGAQVFS